jgi:hypothetical protein
VESPELPLTIPPGIGAPVRVSHVPDDVGAGWGRLSVISNDPIAEKTAEIAAEAAVLPPVTIDVIGTESKPVDVLFAVDQSGSMSDDRDRLAAGFETFISTVGSVTEGWQVGVVTRDDGCLNEGILDAGTLATKPHSIVRSTASGARSPRPWSSCPPMP